MKKILLILILVQALANTGIAGVQSIVAKSKIAAVTVYSDRAMVTRIANLELQPGTYEVKIEDLPAVILEDSLRTSCKGSAEAKVTGTVIKKVFLERVGDARIKSLETEIRQLEDKDRGIADTISVLYSRRKFLESFGKYSSEKIEKEMALQKMDIQTWQNAISFFADGLTEVNQKIQKSEIEKRNLQEKLQALKKELQEIKTSRPLEKRAISIDLEVAKAGNWELNISYVVMDARWSPFYDARVLMKTRELEMTYFGEIVQKTGEDWNDIELALSTARPAIGAKSPELQPWYLNIYEPIPLPGLKEKGELSRELKAWAAVETSMTSVMFRVKKKESIPGDGSRHKVTISIDTLKPTFDYIAVPKIAEQVYLKSVVINKTSYPFIAGQVQVFQDADYIGKSSLNLIVPDETFTLDLGIDPNIRVKRDLVSKSKETRLFFGKSEKVSYLYKIIVENFKDSQESVTVVDQIPVSQDEKIKIGIDKISPEPQEKTPQGMLKWKFSLSPKEKKEILLGFTIGYPSGVIITGLGE